MVLQEVPTHQLIQGMHTISSHIVSIPLIETYGDMPSGILHDQGLEQHANLKQDHITVQRNLDLIKEGRNNHPSLSLMNYIQPFELKCGFSEDGMSMILCTVAGYEFNIVPFHETTYVLPCRSTTFSLSSSVDERPPSFLGHSKGSFNHESLEVNMIDGRHLEMRNIFSFPDDTFSMSTSQLKEKLILSADQELIGFGGILMRRRSHGEISLEVHFNTSWSTKFFNSLRRLLPPHTWIFMDSRGNR